MAQEPTTPQQADVLQRPVELLSLDRARQMLQQLEQERLEAAKAGATSKFIATYIDERLAAIGANVNHGLLSELNAPSRPSCEALERELRAGYMQQSILE